MNTGKDCILADNEQEFEVALDVLISDKKRRTAMGKAANLRARKDFNVDEVTKHYIKCLEEAISLKASKAESLPAGVA